MKCYQHSPIEKGLESLESLMIKSLKNFLIAPHHKKISMVDFGNVVTKNWEGFF